MTVIEGLRIAGSSAVLALVLVGLIRRYALRHQILDHPGPRTSHTRPTPRGGGLGLVIAFLVVMFAVPGLRSLVPVLLALVGVAITALVGWLDDHRSLGVRARLVAHLVAGVTLLPLALWPAAVPAWLGIGAAFWWVFWAVSAINVVNFMDGIDGLIGTQALIFGAHLASAGVAGGLPETFGLALAGASAGFLIWNWPAAKIFLGDVGSGALGFLFVLGGLLLMTEGQASIVTAFLPLFALFLDASVTLTRRLRRGEPITQAHRSHLYQRLANGGWGHARVSLLYAAVALLALPITALPATWMNLGIVAYFLAVLVLATTLDRRAP